MAAKGRPSVERVTFDAAGVRWTAVAITAGRPERTWLYFLSEIESRRTPWMPGDWWAASADELRALLDRAERCSPPAI